MMNLSVLQASLIAIGVLVLLAVIAYNVWRERRSRPMRADAAAGEAVGAQVGDRRTVGDTTGSGAERARIDPVLSLDGAAARGPIEQQGLQLDGLIDVIVPLALDGAAVPGSALLAAAPETHRVGGKRFLVEAQVSPAAWELPRAGGSYTAVQAGVQMASRAGALNEIEFSDFIVVVQRLADAIGATPEFPEMAHEIARARELDQFASAHDVRLNLVVRACASAWSADFVRQKADELGWKPTAAAGRLVLPSPPPASAPLLELLIDPDAAEASDLLRSAVDEVKLGFDVARVEETAQPFQRLREMALSLASALDGRVTDEAGRPLAIDALDAIAGDLRHLYVALDQHGLAAGSPAALRLFG